MKSRRGLRWALVLGAAILTVGLAAAALFYAHLEYQVRVARRLLAESDAKGALLILQEIEPWAANRAEVQYLLAVANRREGNLHRVEGYLTRAAELGWPGPDLKRQRALGAFQSGRIAEAQPYLNRLMLQEVSDEAALEIYEGMTKGYLLDLRLRDAERCLKLWIAWRPDDVQPRLMLADIWHSIYDREREGRELADLLAIHPENVEARQKYGEWFLQTNELPKALEEFTRCHQLAPLDVRFVMLMAYCYSRLGETSNAEHYLDEALRLDHDNFQESFALTVKGQIDLEQKRYEQAEPKLRRALELTPGSQTAQFALATVLTRLGRKAEAEEHFKAATQMEDEDVRLADLTRKVIRQPNDAEARLEVAHLLLARGSAEMGLRWLRSALMVKPRDRAIHEELAAAYEQRGNAELAAEYRRSAQMLAAAEKAPSALPDNTSPSNTSPSNTSPDNTSPGNTSPGNTSPDNTSPDNTSPDNTPPGSTPPGSTSPDNTPPDS